MVLELEVVQGLVQGLVREAEQEIRYAPPTKINVLKYARLY
jgi:hypothetical protein